jgi:hypothetical protein
LTPAHRPLVGTPSSLAAARACVRSRYWGASQYETKREPAEDDVALHDEYARASGLPSGFAALWQAVHVPGHADLEKGYASAWDQWDCSGGQGPWEAKAADGLTDPAR